MAKVTYYVALPFTRKQEGDLVAGEPVECQTSNAAVRTAARQSLTATSAVAFSRTSDPATGEFADAEIIKVIGEPVSREALPAS
jgi:hypothetical protein